MNIIIDTCSLINLIHSNKLDEILSITKNKFHISEFVLDELSIKNTEKFDIINKYIFDGKIKYLTNNFSAIQFNQLKNELNLGIGETECIAFSIRDGYIMCTDDKTARNRASEKIGSENIIGSLNLLKKAVEAEILDCTIANICYQSIKSNGGFVPKIPITYFCKNSIP